ncbi:hypothetical protein LO771_03375 [Streptacidiphilus sp. ASG 303]|nr:hypothetical protein [Streptacidiphilus sp. ASG 303]
MRVFFLDQVSPGQGRAYLERERRLAGERHRALRELADALAGEPDPLAVNGLLALEWGLRFTRMQEEWAEWAAERLAAAPAAAPPPAD